MLIRIVNMDNIKKWLKNNNISDVECLVPDMTGTPRGKFVPSREYFKQILKLPEGMLLQTVDGDYCAEHEQLVCPDDKDMVLVAVPDSMRLTPWSKRAKAQIIHDCKTIDGKDHPLACRNVLRSIIEQYKTLGLKIVIAPEIEFFLIKQNNDPNMELEPPMGQSGLSESVRQPLGMDAIYEFEPFIDTLYEYSKIQNLNVGSLVHENGRAQLEINFHHGDPLTLADQVFIFKRTVKQAAYRHGMIATFMAKPLANEAGSSMHIHQSVYDIKTNKNIFANDNGEKTDAFMHYLGGLQKYSPKLLSFYAPNVNSYRRFTNFMNAPINLRWGYDNRTIAFRVPISDITATRIENRIPGIDTNPYLSISATLASGLAGMKNKLQPTASFKGDASGDKITIIRSLEKSLDNLKDLGDFGDIIAPEFINAYRCVKFQELDNFNKVITSWEREKLLLSV